MKKALRWKLWIDYEVYINGCTSMLYILKGAFHLLKNVWQDTTTQVVLCLICKFFLKTWQIGGKEQDKNRNSSTSSNHSTIKFFYHE